MTAPRATPQDLFAGRPLALAVVDAVVGMVASIGEASIRTTKTQVAFRRRRGFAWLWPPVFDRPGVEIVLSIALDRHDPSGRFKQVAHPTARLWMHHLEIRDSPSSTTRSGTGSGKRIPPRADDAIAERCATSTR